MGRCMRGRTRVSESRQDQVPATCCLHQQRNRLPPYHRQQLRLHRRRFLLRLFTLQAPDHGLHLHRAALEASLAL